MAIEVVVEDGFDRSVGARADGDGAGGGGLEPLGAERLDQADDAETGAEALLGMRLVLEDQLAQRRRVCSYQRGVLADAIDGPVGTAAVARRHVVRHGRVLVIAAHALMRGNACTLDEDLDRARADAHLDFAAGEAMRNAVVVAVDLDVIIDADAAHTPLGEHVGLLRQRLERRAVELFEQLAARDAEATDRPLLVEARQELADRPLTSSRLKKVRWRRRPSS